MVGVAAVGAATGGSLLANDQPAEHEAEGDDGPTEDEEPTEDDEEVEDPGAGLQRIVWSVQTDGPRAALTFDDGPHPDLTPRILDILHDHGIAATFMAMGHAAEQHPELIQLVDGAGHEVGHHTWQHKNLATVDSNTEARRQIDNGVRLVEEAVGHRVRWFRPPRGRLTETAIRLIAEHGHDIALWSVSRGGLDERSPRRVADYVVEKTGPGDIIDFHDGIGRGTFDPEGDLADELMDRRLTEVAALPTILRELRDRGVQLGTIGDLTTNGRVMT